MSTCEEMTNLKIRNSCCSKKIVCIQMLVVHVQVGSNHLFTLSFFYDSFALSLILSFSRSFSRSFLISLFQPVNIFCIIER